MVKTATGGALDWAWQELDGDRHDTAVHAGTGSTRGHDRRAIRSDCASLGDLTSPFEVWWDLQWVVRTWPAGLPESSDFQLNH
jgi:hypothetical protein